MNMLDIDAVTDHRIAALRQEAGGAGDAEMVRDCDLALAGDVPARYRIAEALADAEAQDDTPDHATEISDLSAYRVYTDWVVEDLVGGGVWYPDDATQRAIQDASDPDEHARVLALTQPMRGTWKA